MVYIVFLGAPGAGKGTQAASVARKLKLDYIATGDLFRQALEQGTELGLAVKSYMEKGVLVPDQITIGMVMERISAPNSGGGAVFDGFPRNMKQAEALDEALARQGKSIDKVVYIKVSEEEVLKRLGGRRVCRQCQAPCHVTDSPPKVEGVCDVCGGELYQRPDDSEESIKKRLEVYSDETAPLIDYYRQAGKLLEVAGEGGVEMVGKRVVDAIGENFYS